MLLAVWRRKPLRVTRKHFVAASATLYATAIYLRYPAAAAPSGIVPPKLKLVYRTQLGRYLNVVSGALPATASQGADGTTLQIAVSQATATAFGLLAAAAGLLLLAALTVAVQHALTPARAAPD